MRRKLWAILLTIGTIVGFAWGFHSVRHHSWHGHHGPHGRRAAFEDHVAEVCTRAAAKVMREPARADARPAP